LVAKISLDLSYGAPLSLPEPKALLADL